MYNGALTEYSTKAYQEAEDAKFDANAKKTNEGLVEKFGSQEKVDHESELFRRAILNYPDITPEVATEVADVIAESMQRGGANAAAVLLGMIAPMAREGGSLSGDGSGSGTNIAQPSPREACKARFPASEETWLPEGTKWEDVDAKTKAALGYKTK